MLESLREVWETGMVHHSLQMNQLYLKQIFLVGWSMVFEFTYSEIIVRKQFVWKLREQKKLEKSNYNKSGHAKLLCLEMIMEDTA